MATAASVEEGVPLLERELISDEPPEVRAGFITKVYGILTAQLLLTAAIAAPFILLPPVRLWAQGVGYLQTSIGATSLLCVAGCTVLFMALRYGEMIFRTFPVNYLLLAGFTASEGVILGVHCAAFQTPSVVCAFALTAVLVGGLALYAFVTKTDFAGVGPYLFAGCVVLMFFGLFPMFVQWPLVHKVFYCLGILLFSLYLIYDTQMIVGNGQCSLGVDDCVYGALQLYLDFILLLLFILNLFSGDREEGD